MQVWRTRVIQVIEIEAEVENSGTKGEGKGEEKEEGGKETRSREHRKVQSLRNAIFATRELLGEGAQDAELGGTGEGGFIPMVVEEKPREVTTKQRADILCQDNPPTPRKERTKGPR